MVIIQSKSKRKPSGARYKAKIIKKRQHLIGRQAAHTRIDKKRIKPVRARSGMIKLKALSIDKINIYDPKTKKYSVETAKNVIDSPQDKNFVRRKIMSKGSIIETSKGKAKVTNRPGQDGIVNAVLIE